ncbi:MAG TPA: hypothetical protein VKE93_06025, partial [Candidatus Angelobacter sp.]|nr:hypothetical protein [Candidatus Angelobacter sp.]
WEKTKAVTPPTGDMKPWRRCDLGDHTGEPGRQVPRGECGCGGEDHGELQEDFEKAKGLQ